MPVAREIQLAVGICSASANALIKLLTQSNDPDDKSNRDGYTSNAVGLVVGGCREQRISAPYEYKFCLKNRKGFVRIALKTGAPLVPAISFGENDYYQLTHWKPINKIDRAFCYGRGLLQYNIGFIPRRVPVTTVIGAPIDVEYIKEPNDDVVNKYHEIFCTKIKELFEEHKGKYIENSETVQLEFV